MKTVYQVVKESEDRELIKKMTKELDEEAAKRYRELSKCLHYIADEYKKLADFIDSYNKDE